MQWNNYRIQRRQKRTHDRGYLTAYRYFLDDFHRRWRAAARSVVHVGQSRTLRRLPDFGPGHHEIWQGWRQSRDLDAGARAVVRAYEYEDWPRGRIVFNREQNRFILYCDC